MLVLAAGPGVERYLDPLRAAGLEVALRQETTLEAAAEEALDLGAHLLWSPDPAVSAEVEASWAVRLGLAGLTLFPAYPLRYLAPMMRAVDLIRAGSVGPLRALRLIYQGPAGGADQGVRLHHLADLYRQVTGESLREPFAFPGSPFVSGGGAVPASFDLRESRDGSTALLLEAIGEAGTLLADGYGQRVALSGGQSTFVGDPPEAAVVAAFLKALRL